MLCGCVYGGDKRPDSNIPSLWISEDPHIEIEFIQGYEDGPVFTSVRGILDPICRVYLDGKMLHVLLSPLCAGNTTEACADKHEGGIRVQWS